MTYPMPSIDANKDKSAATLPFAVRFKDGLATLPSLFILGILIFAGVQKTIEIVKHTDETTVQISLTEPAPEPEPEPIKPQPVTPQTTTEAKPTAQPTAPSPVPVAPNTTPTTNQPATTTAPSPVVAAAPAPTASPAPATPAKAEPVKNNASAEGEYVAKLRAQLNAIKRYPTGREASQQKPQGRVKVWFVLKRTGELVEQGIEESSNSMLLDEAARKTINRATFSAFPEGSWSSENSHKFTAELEFIVPGS